MKIAYKVAGSAAAYVTLFDETATVTAFDAGAVGISPSPEFKPSHRTLVQRTPLYNAPTEFRNPNGNTSVSLPLRFWTPYATRAAALYAIGVTFPALLNQKLHLQVTQDATVLYYPNAVSETYDPELTGAGAWHELAFTADPAQLAAP